PPSTPSPPVTQRQGYSNVVSADGFESGALAWNGTPGNGTVSVLAGAAHAGSYGLRMANASGQYSYAVKALPSALADSSTSFWVRPTSGSGLETVAEARDGSSSSGTTSRARPTSTTCRSQRRRLRARRCRALRQASAASRATAPWR